MEGISGVLSSNTIGNHNSMLGPDVLFKPYILSLVRFEINIIVKQV